MTDLPIVHLQPSFAAAETSRLGKGTSAPAIHKIIPAAPVRPPAAAISDAIAAPMLRKIIPIGGAPASLYPQKPLTPSEEAPKVARTKRKESPRMASILVLVGERRMGR
ncbi:hypothetical protein [Tropicimonas marinistellae]|uniref:hypothetical protein n=1 Tax=Tropicimonas marinistellae TaxID=1739787 RepID=UPI00122E98FE|nr:hypothetical protein [Tropicimonas marinistellae]